MQRHERVPQVKRAELALFDEVVKISRKYEVTDIEMLQIFTSMQQFTLKYMLREERHPDDPGKPADIA